MHEKWRNNLLFMASLTEVTSTGFASSHIEASGQRLCGNTLGKRECRRWCSAAFKPSLASRAWL